MKAKAAADTRPAILIVDDIDANLLALEAQLESLDCDIVCARSGNEALGHLLRREFALLLLDVQMPEMDGFEVARLARQNVATRDVPIVFVTATHETEESVLQGYGSGAIDFLFKPINAQVLRGKVRVFLELYEGRRRLLAEIEAHKRTLGELEAFNYSVSHDLRAPLRPLDGFADALLEDYGPALDEKGRDYLRRIQAAARRMGELIDDLLELSRVSRTPVRRQSVDLATIARAIIEELRAGDPARVVDFVVAPSLTAQGDARLLRIALENLLRNAWKFTRTRPRARIEIGVRESAELSFFVADDGVGFDPAFAARLFQPFQRLHGVTEFEGTGIGLAIVSRIVGGHGGRIWADASVDGGARFFFTLAPSRGPASR
jgi:two-component system, sensor histidine kinase and response regulator